MHVSNKLIASLVNKRHVTTLCSLHHPIFITPGFLTVLKRFSLASSIFCAIRFVFQTLPRECSNEIRSSRIQSSGKHYSELHLFYHCFNTLELCLRVLSNYSTTAGLVQYCRSLAALYEALSFVLPPPYVSEFFYLRAALQFEVL